MILVVGATGLLGDACIRILCNRHHLVALTHRSSILGSVIDARHASVLDIDQLSTCMSDVSVIIYAPSFSTPTTTPMDVDIEISKTVRGLYNLIECSSFQDYKPHIIFPSTAGAIYGDTDKTLDEDSTLQPINSYGYGKQISEMTLEFYSRLGKIDYTILRFANLYGYPGRRRVNQSVIDIFLDDALTGTESRVWAEESSTRDYLHVDDAARAIEAVLDNLPASRNRTFNVASGVDTTLSDILDIVHETTGGRHMFSRVERRTRAPSHTRIDPSRFRRTFAQWERPLSVREGVAIAWHRKLAHRAHALADSALVSI